MEWKSDPDILWSGTRLGREELVQRLLSGLVVGHDRARWNVPETPSQRGRRYLEALTAPHLPEPDLSTAVFIDEFELPRRHDDEKSGWPDQAVVSHDHLVLIELKTEVRSHRPGQLDHYLDLAAHHYLDRSIDLLYITPAMTAAPPTALPLRCRYAHVSWEVVRALVVDIWASSPELWERRVAERLAWWLDEVEAQRPPPPRPELAAPPALSAVDAVELALQQAAAVQRDGAQAALDLWLGSPDALDELRLEVRDALRDGAEVDGQPLTHVLPWLWSASTSTGPALTATGAEHGYELRLSRYRKPLWKARSR